MPIFEPFPHHLDRVFMAFDYLRIDGWAVPPGDNLTALEIRIGDALVHRETTRVGLPSPDVALHERCRFATSCLIPDAARAPSVSLRLIFGHHAPLELPLNTLASGWSDDLTTVRKRFLSLVPPGGRVLEIGSRNRTGFDFRSLLPGADHVGIDIAPGPGVDRVVDAHDLGAAFEPRSFDAVCSFVVFEHLAMPWKVALEMNRVLRPGGVAYVLSVQTCALHELPWDYFRFSDSAYRAIFNAASGFEVLETGLSVPVHIFPFVASPMYPDAEKAAGFGSSEVVVRKIGETELSWNVPISAVTQSSYPENAPLELGKLTRESGARDADVAALRRMIDEQARTIARLQSRLDSVPARREAATTPPAARSRRDTPALPVLLVCDDPAEGAPPISSETVRFRGWALAPEGVAEVQLRLDGVLVASAVPALPRPDVAAAHTSYPANDRAGYEMVLDRRALAAGEHTATLRAVTSRGRTAEIARKVHLATARPPAPETFQPARLHIEWAGGERRASVCPACRRQGMKEVSLSIDAPRPGLDRLWLLRCPDCASSYIQGFRAPVDLPEVRRPSFIQYYVEQGAGIDIMVRPLSALADGTPSSLVEIGCGFGFALDFAVRELGWSGRGIEPSFWGGRGRELLGLDIRAELLRPELPAEGSEGCVYASEVLEHLDDPALLFDWAARALRPDGRLALTTPDGARITRDRGVDELWMIVSPGLHHVLFSAAALEASGRAHGFPHARVRREHDTLSAQFGRLPLPADAGGDDERWHRRYHRYLAGRLGTFSVESPLHTGFAYRLFKETVNRGRYDEASDALAALVQSVRLRFGLALDEPASLRLGDAELLDFDAFAEAYPFCLASSLYFLGVFQRDHRHDAAAAGRCFDAVAGAHRLVHHALGSVAAVDGETEDLARHAAAQAALARTAVLA